MSQLTAKDIDSERMLKIVGHPGDGQVHEWWGDIDPYEIVAATLNEYGFPDLLEALKWYVENDDTNEVSQNIFWIEGRDKARSAINKATGAQS